MDLLFEIPHNLPLDICKELIDKFENDTRKKPGVIGSGLNLDIKSSIDLPISRLQDWDEMTTILKKYLDKGIAEYNKFLVNKLPISMDMSRLTCSAFQIQKSGHYKWHVDTRIEFGKVRVLTYIWYLNTIEDGGETGFVYKKVKPEAGKLVFFPATWDYVHCGFPAENKYILTGWLWSEVNQV
ncbi:MAG: 2OG-Fe(II) oxygenase [Methylococcales bacterium]|nr:MAG: 2OG-Fe(II) oxygenase [Methylococcales bacterium]